MAGRFWNLALDSDGYLYGADLNNASRVMRINTVDRTTTLLAGGGSDAGEGVPALTASLQGVWGVDMDAAGNVLIVESERHRVRRVDAATGLINTIAGTGVAGYGGDGGPALQAQFSYPADVESVGSAGAVIAGNNNYRVRAFGIAPSTSADLSVAATAADEQVRVGETLGYGVTVANAGPDAADSTGVGFALDAELPDLQVQAPEGWSCDEPSVGEGTTLASCNASELASEASADFTVTATAPVSASGRSVTLTAAATSRTSDPDEENNSDGASIGVTPVADVSVTLEGPRKVAFGAKAKYVVTVANAGPSVAPDPVVVLASDMSARSVALQVPEGWNCVRGESARFTAYCVAQSGELGGELPAFTLTVGSSGQLSASSFTVGAEAYSEASDPVPSNNARSLKAFRYAFSY